MHLLLISGFILSFVLSGIIFFKKKDKSVSDNILAIWLIFLGLDYLRSYFLFEENRIFLLGFGYTMPAIDAPFLFMYVYSLSSSKSKFNPKLLYHLIPFLLYNLYLFFFIYIKSPAEKLIFFHETTFSTRPFLFHVFQAIMILIVPFYIIWIFKLIKKYNRNLENLYSCKEKMDLKWISFLLISASVIWVVVTLTKFITGYYNTLQYDDTLMTIFYFELIIIVIIGYFGFKQDLILFNFTEPVPEIKAIKKYNSTGLSKEKASQLKFKILELMKSEKPYLLSDLSLDKLANFLKISPHHVSQVINEHLGKNFFEFVNEYRVEEVKQLISLNKGKKYTLLSLAFESGFNSKSTFNSTFKKYTKLTPKEYMEINT